MSEKKEFQEFPKSLYAAGDRNADHRVVANAEEEKAARDDGFRMIGDPAPEAKPEKEEKKSKK